MGDKLKNTRESCAKVQVKICGQKAAKIVDMKKVAKDLHEKNVPIFKTVFDAKEILDMPILSMKKCAALGKENEAPVLRYKRQCRIKTPQKMKTKCVSFFDTENNQMLSRKSSTGYLSKAIELFKESPVSENENDTGTLCNEVEDGFNVLCQREVVSSVDKNCKSSFFLLLGTLIFMKVFLMQVMLRMKLNPWNRVSIKWKLPFVNLFLFMI